MKPPARPSRQSTWRTDTTCADTVRPTHVEAHGVADLNAETVADALFDRHLAASDDGVAGHAAPSTIVSLRSSAAR